MANARPNANPMLQAAPPGELDIKHIPPQPNAEKEQKDGKVQAAPPVDQKNTDSTLPKLAETEADLPPVTNPAHQKRLDTLDAIQKRLLDPKNPYKLNSDTITNVKIIINTLKYIVRDVKALRAWVGKKAIIGPFGLKIPGYCQIHMDYYKPSESTDLEKNEIALMSTRVDLFINGFSYVEELAEQEENKKFNYVNIFLSKMGGDCIDGRMREAFAWLEKLKLTFMESIKVAFEIASEQIKLPVSEDISYFEKFAAVLTHCWGAHYCAEESKYANSVPAGVFDAKSLPLIRDKFTKDLALKADDSFFAIAASVKPAQYFIFLEFLLLHEELLDECGFVADVNLQTNPNNKNEIVFADEVLGNPKAVPRVSTLLYRKTYGILLSLCCDKSRQPNFEFGIVAKLFNRADIFLATQLFSKIVTTIEAQSIKQLIKLFVKKLLVNQLQHTAFVQQVASQVDMLFVVINFGDSEDIKTLVRLGADLMAQVGGLKAFHLLTTPKLQPVLYDLLNEKKVVTCIDEEKTAAANQAYRAALRNRLESKSDAPPPSIPTNVMKQIEKPLIDLTKKVNNQFIFIEALFNKNVSFKTFNPVEFVAVCLAQCESAEVRKKFTEAFLDGLMSVSDPAADEYELMNSIFGEILELSFNIDDTYWKYYARESHGHQKVEQLFLQDEKSVNDTKDKKPFLLKALEDPEIKANNFQWLLRLVHKKYPGDNNPANVIWQNDPLFCHIIKNRSKYDNHKMRLLLFDTNLSLNVEPIQSVILDEKAESINSPGYVYNFIGQSQAKLEHHLLVNKLNNARYEEHFRILIQIYKKNPKQFYDHMKNLRSRHKKLLLIDRFSFFLKEGIDEAINKLDDKFFLQFSRACYKHPINANGDTLLHIFVKYCAFHMLIMQLARDASFPEIARQQNKAGHTPMVAAAYHGAWLGMIALATATVGFADPNDYSRALLILLTTAPDEATVLKCVSILLENRVAIYAMTENEEDGLDIAVRRGFKAIIEKIKTYLSHVSFDDLPNKLSLKNISHRSLTSYEKYAQRELQKGKCDWVIAWLSVLYEQNHFRFKLYLQKNFAKLFVSVSNNAESKDQKDNESQKKLKETILVAVAKKHIHLAVKNEDYQLLESVKSLTNVVDRQSIADLQDEEKNTPLHTAIIAKRALTHRLYALNPNCTLRNAKGHTPLMTVIHERAWPLVSSVATLSKTGHEEALTMLMQDDQIEAAAKEKHGEILLTQVKVDDLKSFANDKKEDLLDIAVRMNLGNLGKEIHYQIESQGPSIKPFLFVALDNQVTLETFKVVASAFNGSFLRLSFDCQWNNELFVVALLNSGNLPKINHFFSNLPRRVNLLPIASRIEDCKDDTLAPILHQPKVLDRLMMCRLYMNKPEEALKWLNTLYRSNDFNKFFQAIAELAGNFKNYASHAKTLVRDVFRHNIHLACEWGDTNFVKVLIGTEAIDTQQVNIRNDAKDIPLHTTLKHKPIDPECVRALLTAGAQVAWLDGQGNSPFTLALQSRDVVATELILTELIQRKIPLTRIEQRALSEAGETFKALDHTYRAWLYQQRLASIVKQGPLKFSERTRYQQKASRPSMRDEKHSTTPKRAFP